MCIKIYYDMISLKNTEVHVLILCIYINTQKNLEGCTELIFGGTEECYGLNCVSSIFIWSPDLFPQKVSLFGDRSLQRYNQVKIRPQSGPESIND